jgi:hypothetical protein
MAEGQTRKRVLRTAPVALVGTLVLLLAACGGGRSPLQASSSGRVDSPTTVAPTTTVPATTPPTAAPSTTTPSATTPSSSRSLTQQSALVRKADEDGTKERWVRTVTVNSSDGTETRVLTLSGPAGGYQEFVDGSASCKYIYVNNVVYVSCTPGGGEEFMDWPEAGAERVGTTWVSYQAGDAPYSTLSEGITTRSALSSFFIDGGTSSSGVIVGHLASRKVGKLVEVAAPLTLTENGETAHGDQIVYVSGTTHPLITEVAVDLNGAVSQSTLSDWGSKTAWTSLVRQPAKSITFHSVSSILTPSSST